MSDDPAPLPSSSRLRRFAPGEKFAGRYRLIETLGQGGMGVVWRAHDESLEIDVALKFLHDVLACDNEALRDLKRETRRALQLTHPHIVRVHSLVEDNERRIAAISMEYVPGENLTRRRSKQPTRYFSPDDLAPWLGQLCEALNYAHNKAGIIHRDLKPANILLDAQDEVRITDFGISATANNSMTRLTGAANDSGTLAYMSPQQARGERPTPSDDLYALGSTLYELLTGKPPFYMGSVLTQLTGRTPPRIEQRRDELFGKSESIPEHWEQLVASLLAKDPAGRPASARDVASTVGITLSVTSGPTSKASNAPVQSTASTATPTNTVEAIPKEVASSAASVAAVLPAVSPQGGKATKLIGAICGVLLLAAAVVFAVVKFGGPARTKAQAQAATPLSKAPPSPAPLAAETTTKPPEAQPEPESPPPEPVVPAPVATPQELQATRAPLVQAALLAPRQQTAGEWRVPEEHPTIRAALSAASKGETIVVGPGTYSEFIELRSGVRIRGTDATLCRVEPPEGARCTLLAVKVSDATVENLTFFSPAKDKAPIYNAGWKLDTTLAAKGTPTPAPRDKPNAPRIGREKSGLIRVVSVDEGGPAAKAGIIAGDIIVSVDGIAVSTADAADALLARRLQMASIRVHILRQNESEQTTLTPQLSPAEGWQDGLVLIDSGVTVRGCNVQGFGGNGIVIEGHSAARVENCLISDSGRRGLYITESPAKIIGTRFEANRGPGIIAEKVSGDLLLEGNIVTGCLKGSGILFNNVVGTIRGCTSDSNNLAGIAVMNAASNALLENNKCRKNKTHGIWFSNRARGNATGNLCEGNEASGLTVIGDGTVVVSRKNRLDGNKTPTFTPQGGRIEK